MRRWLLAPLFFLFGAVALGGFYSYRDDHGTLHAVSSPDDIPAQYRGKERQTAGSESGAGDVNIKLQREGNSLLVPVDFGDGNEVLLVLDTGASVSMISSEVAERMQFKQVGLAQITSASGVIQVPVVKVPTISVKQFSVKDMPVTVNNIPGERRTQGLLGVDYLNHFRIQLDTESGQLHLERK